MNLLARFAAAGALVTALTGAAMPRDLAIPRYTHIFVIMEENKDYGQIIDSPDAPTLTKLAHAYGYATNFYAETHPSEPNYVALVGGSTFGIRDDDAYYCAPNDDRRSCRGSHGAGYVNHTIDQPEIGTQLDRAGLTWKNYNESLPEPGSLAVVATDPNETDLPKTLFVYASKHSGFVNYRDVQQDPKRAQHLVGFNQLWSDLHSGNVPSFSLIVPNICNEMHGEGSLSAPEGCNTFLQSKLIWRGDRNVARIVDAIMASPAWRAKENAAIVITFDEDGHGGHDGCCGNDPNDPSNAGGGHIATIVATNHGPHGATDATPYNHYSLLRTIEDAFGIHDYLQHAADVGVQPMTPLFR